MTGSDRVLRGPRSNEQMVERLLVGLGRALEEREFTLMTVADVVAAAGTSKRSFYENFSTKGDCLLEHYLRYHRSVMAEIARQAPLAPSERQATVVGVEIYFRSFVTQPHIARAHLLDVLTIGQAGVEARAETTWTYVRGMQQVMATPRDDRPARLLDDTRGLGILGGINEIALDVLARDDATMLEDAVSRAIEFVRSVIRDLPPMGETPA